MRDHNQILISKSESGYRFQTRKSTEKYYNTIHQIYSERQHQLIKKMMEDKLMASKYVGRPGFIDICSFILSVNSFKVEYGSFNKKESEEFRDVFERYKHPPL